MNATELSVITKGEFEAALKDVRRLTDKSFSAEFPHSDDTIIEVYNRRNVIGVDLLTTDPVEHHEGYELFPYEGIQIFKVPELGSHRVTLISGTKKRNKDGILANWRGGSMARASESVSYIDDNLGVLFELSAHEPGHEQYLSLLPGLRPEDRLDPYGRTLDQVMQENVVVGQVTLLAAEIVTNADRTGQIVAAKGSDRFTFSTKALSIEPEGESFQESEGIMIAQRKASKNTGYEHVVYVVGKLGLEKEMYRVRRETDGRLERRISDKKYGNPVNVEVGRTLVSKMQRVSLH